MCARRCSVGVYEGVSVSEGGVSVSVSMGMCVCMSVGECMYG